MSDSLDDDFDSTSSAKPAAGSTKSAWMIGIIVGGGLLFFLLCCGGIGVFFYFGTQVLNEEIKNELKENTVIVEQIGVIRELEVDWIKSTAIEGDDVFVYRIVGDAGSGYATIESITNDEGVEEVIGGSLELDSGETFDLFPIGELDSREPESE